MMRRGTARAALPGATAPGAGLAAASERESAIVGIPIRDTRDVRPKEHVCILMGVEADGEIVRKDGWRGRDDDEVERRY